jgi:MoaA/NifB/PqqE/SkfB family radical SAM enzyme
MTAQDWSRVISEAASLGVSRVQFIGGEPTLHPHFAPLVRDAIDAGMSVEVFSNLVQVREEWWSLLQSRNVSLATSYYSDLDEEHGAVTGRRSSHSRTRANIAEAVRRGVRLRVGIIDVLDGQRVEQARAELLALGLTDVRRDRVREVGRGARSQPRVSELCGRCGRKQAAIGPNGDVWPCVLSRWMCAGNVRTTSLARVLTGDAWYAAVAAIPAPRGGHCNPHQGECKPTTGDSRDCAPAERPACNPKFCNPDMAPRNPPRDPKKR